MVASILLSLGLQQTPSASGLELLRHFAGQEVSKDKEGARDLAAYIKKSFNGHYSYLGFRDPGSPIYVLKSPIGFDVFQVNPTIFYNGRADAAFATFDELGKPKNAMAFSAGPGMSVRTRLLPTPGISDPLVEVTVGGSGGGSEQLVYGFDNGRPVLVRMDDHPSAWYSRSRSRGGIRLGEEEEPAWEKRVSYKSGLWIGPEPPAYSKSQLLAALRGENMVQKLGTLVWLDGIHRQPNEKIEQVAQESVSMVARYWALVRDREVISAALEQRRSKLPWVSEAAHLFASLSPHIADPAPYKRERRLTDKLRIEDLVVGRGTEFSDASPLSSNDRGVFEYVGKLPDGTVFDTNEGRFQCAEIGLDPECALCCEGLRQGLIGMRPGGERRIIVPASMAFGSVGAGKVPPNSDVEYRVRLLHNASLAPRSGHDTRIGTGQVAADGMMAEFQRKAWYLSGRNAELTMKNPSSVILESSALPNDFASTIVGMRQGGVRRALINGFTLLKDHDFGCTDLIVQIQLDKLSGTGLLVGSAGHPHTGPRRRPETGFHA